MSNKFDSYREALVVENHTIWSDEFDDWSREDRSRMEAILHANPEQVAFLDYVRQHTGFARQITVTAADLQRLSAH
ncbi:MAG: hypothetical protein WCR23_02935 [Planctomycetota bacterium]|jgi:hypothetical protein|nr:hypothetical protein [Planctomycetia bacterium]MDO7679299.1 hypothetical protein [Pirellulales bacterium]RLS31798.1 MAG: hypothetical protein DWH80_05440 [Planctomycetota bacterium]RLS58708.1 MAG: hypothetical protein DWH94_05090 [Planctomycetota bacterium]